MHLHLYLCPNFVICQTLFFRGEKQGRISCSIVIGQERAIITIVFCVKEAIIMKINVVACLSVHKSSVDSLSVLLPFIRAQKRVVIYLGIELVQDY